MSSSCPSIDDGRLSISQSPAFAVPGHWIAAKQRQAGKAQERFGVFTLWISRHRTRTALRALDSRQLEDIGLNTRAILEDIEKPFWKA